MQSTRTPDVERALATIRQLESGGNYKAQAKGSTASGAYQYVDSTWGGYGGYSRAWHAPAGVQDARARADVQRVIDSHGLEAVPISWYYPRALTDSSWLDRVPAPGAGNTLTVRQYQTRWLSIYDGRPAGTVQSVGQITDGSAGLGDGTTDIGPRVAIDSLMWWIRHRTGIADAAYFERLAVAAVATAGIPESGNWLIGLYADPTSGTAGPLGFPWGVSADALRAAGVTDTALFRTVDGWGRIALAVDRAAVPSTDSWSPVMVELGRRAVAGVDRMDSLNVDPWAGRFAPGAEGAAEEGLGPLPGLLGDLQRILDTLMSPALWQRIGWAALGVVLVIAAVAIIATSR